MTPEQMQELGATLSKGMTALADALTKAQPGVGDVHVSGGGKDKKKKPIMFDQDEDDAKKRDFDLGVFKVTKADADQRKVWGWASVSQVGTDVVIDKQGDIIPIAELEKAANEFMLYIRDMGDMHSKVGVGVPFESMVFTPEKAALGIMAKNDDGKNIYGWWAGWQINDDAVWADFKAGKRPEFSIGGRSGWTDQA
jgi:hypothetical protein